MTRAVSMVSMEYRWQLNTDHQARACRQFRMQKDRDGETVLRDRTRRAKDHSAGLWIYGFSSSPRCSARCVRRGISTRDREAGVLASRL